MGSDKVPVCCNATGESIFIRESIAALPIIPIVSLPLSAAGLQRRKQPAAVFWPQSNSGSNSSPLSIITNIAHKPQNTVSSRASASVSMSPSLRAFQFA
jgi:hypothetical protein